MYLPQNLKYLRSKKGLTQEQIGNELNIKRTTYKDYEMGANEPNLNLLLKLTEYFKVNIDHLLKVDLEKAGITEMDGGNLKILAITVDPEGKENVELVPAKAKAGYLTGFSDPVFISTLPKLKLPNLPMGTYRAFEIEGDSMLPLEEGSVVITRYVEHWRDVKSLSTYVFLTKEGIVYKRVINQVKKNGYFIMLSDNGQYDPYFLAQEEVAEIWEYHSHYSRTYFAPEYVTVLKKLLDEQDIRGLGEIMRKQID